MLTKFAFRMVFFGESSVCWCLLSLVAIIEMEQDMQKLDNKVISITEAIFHILKKTGETDKLKLIKLLYLADKYHLLAYGRTITDDTYFAMQYGPVGSITKNVISFDDFNLTSDELNFISQHIKKLGDTSLEAIDVKRIVDYSGLSETDVEALDFVIKKFGDFSSAKLVKYTHKYPEWSQHEKSLSSGSKRREELKTSELFSIVDNSFDLTQEHIETSKLIAQGKL